jgi:hypothetical protein
MKDSNEIQSGNGSITCRSKTTAPHFEVEITPEDSNGFVSFRYTNDSSAKKDSFKTERGIISNFPQLDLDSPTKIYEFSQYRLMLTLESTQSGFYPATLENKNNIDPKFIDLMCTKSS